MVNFIFIKNRNKIYVYEGFAQINKQHIHKRCKERTHKFTYYQCIWRKQCQRWYRIS